MFSFCDIAIDMKDTRQGHRAERKIIDLIRKKVIMDKTLSKEPVSIRFCEIAVFITNALEPL